MHESVTGVTVCNVVLLSLISLNICRCLFDVQYRRSDVPGGSPGLEGISGGGEPMPISGSCVNRKPCGWHKHYQDIIDFKLYNMNLKQEERNTDNRK